MTDTWQAFLAAAKACREKAEAGAVSGGDADALMATARRHLDTIPTIHEVMERRGLVSFQRVADWIARPPGGEIAPDEARRKQAYTDLWRAIVDGEFGPPRRPRVWLLPSTALDELGIALAMRQSRTIPSDQVERTVASLTERNHEPLADAWAQRTDVAKWYAARQHFLPPPPPWLAPATAATLTAPDDQPMPEASSGKPSTHQANPGIRSTRAAKAEAACADWIKGLTERPFGKDAAFLDAKDAVKSIGPLSRKAFDRAWALNARPEWQRAGRRKKR